MSSLTSLKMKDKISSFSQLKSLLFALEHFPEKTPLRWSLVAKYVDESKFEDKTRIRVGGSLKSKSGEAEGFNPTHRVVTRYMGSGITASGSGSWTRDPGSQVMGSGSANFFLSWTGSRIDRFLDTLFFLRNKNIPFCKEKGLFSGLLKKLLTFILPNSFTFLSRNQLFKAFLARISCCITLQFRLCRTL